MSRAPSRVDYRLGSLYALVTAALYAVQEPFSFLAANRLNALQFVFLTQLALFVSLPFLALRAKAAAISQRSSERPRITASSRSFSRSG